MERTNTDGSPVSTPKLAVGVVLMVVGVLLFLDAIDIWNFGRAMRHGWPLILIFLGLVGEIAAFRQRKSAAGHILLAIGIWMFIGVNGYFGLSVGEAMPIGVVVAGLGIVVHALIDEKPVKPGEEGK